MAQQWYWMQDGQKRGPVATAGLRELVAKGQLKPTDMIWREGLPKWVPAAQAKGLFPAETPTATPVVAAPLVVAATVVERVTSPQAPPPRRAVTPPQAPPPRRAV
ncbi:MAG: DUF4339 domain-containing protein, partial [Planctomycetia bacterium]|nr:DUF4339 domain-containing protein [Planctomycetia bacterium]